MGLQREAKADPFVVTGERFVDRCILEHAMMLEPDARRILTPAQTLGFWETKEVRPQPVGGTRTSNLQRSWWRGFYQRIGVAVVGGVFLIAPMWLMVLHNTLYTALVATTLFVAAFGLLMAYVLDKLMEVLSTTAAYAAVLVVFVGLTTDNSS